MAIPFFRPLVSLTFGVLVSAPLAQAQTATDAVAPETGSAVLTEADSPAVAKALAAKVAGEPVESKHWMVVAANPLATEAGAKVLRAGGTAADAMVAVQTVLGLVEPQSSGLGGGAFLVWYDAAKGELTTLDGRETAPKAARPTLFQDESGQPLKFYDAVVGGRSVGTPGTPRLMEEAHRRWGKAPWSDLLADATRLAEEGFSVSPRLAALVAKDVERLGRFPGTRSYFLPGGTPLAEGSLLKNPGYAATLKAMAAGGADAFYKGLIAQDIVQTVHGAEGNPGVLALEDLAAYRVVERPPVCLAYREHDICGMGPPSSGALTIGETLGVLRGKDLAGLGFANAESWRLIGDASRLAFADRGRYMADTDFVPMPTKGLLDDGYLVERAKLLDGSKALETVQAGSPTWDHAWLTGQDESIELPSTSHISIVDSWGNALSMTTTVENGFGSRLMTKGGFLLNNELTDFSFRTHDDAGNLIANAVEPGKRPRSSMAPTIVMKDGKPTLVLGTPGGSRIIGFVQQAIIGYLDWDMNAQQITAMPHLVNRFGTFDLEEGTPAADLAKPLEAMGYKVSVRDLNSGLHAIALEDGVLKGGADPRREGVAIGE
ncbi:gamma-glutamyltransferase [Rhodospirillum sp. A1_3_36]|uniref:gamma-glutamyltransferase n=1 Tax=Rhodospirillum sp. A1_3_36 TaxID=3391666 RepID=UPI0039A659F6